MRNRGSYEIEANRILSNCGIAEVTKFEKLGNQEMMDEALEKAKTILWAQQKWPGIYFFKFIVPNDKVKLELVRKLFQSEDQITYRTSKDIRFIALSCKQEMQNPDEVLSVYQKAGEIEGVISL